MYAYMKDWTTLTGVPIEKIAEKLGEHFEPDAYKPIPRREFLTDISTGYMLERLIEVFGPKGLGWTLLFDADDMLVGAPDQNGRVLAYLRKAIFEFRLVKDDEERFFQIETSGSSTNYPEYAPEGARTSAIGAALKGMGFQLDVYKDKLSHSSPAPSRPARNTDRTYAGLLAAARDMGYSDDVAVIEKLKAAGFEGYQTANHDLYLEALDHFEEAS